MCRYVVFFFSSRRRHTRSKRDWSSDVCSSDLGRHRDAQRADRGGRLSMRIRWKLRMAAAQREVWTGAQLRRLLAEKAGTEMSAASVSALFTKEPSQVKLSTLAAVCTALECTPDDLFDV